MPIHISNVTVFSKSGKPVKLKARFNAAAEKELYYVDEGKEVLYRLVKKTK
jgi:hypothetical protein